MPAFLEKLLLRNKAKKVLSYIENVEVSLTLFVQIEINNVRISKKIKTLSKSELYTDIVSRYNVAIQKAINHNKTIQELTIAYDTILANYPIDNVLNDILYIQKETLNELYSTVLKVYQYTIPNTCRNKLPYDTYKKRLEDIICNYDLVIEQKRLISSIYTELNHLPDTYINIDNSSIIFANIQSKIEHYNNEYANKYYNPPIISTQVIEQHNEEFIARHLNDNIFNNVNGKRLDNEQRRSILCDTKSNLTIAGAGAGKTLTICGKVKYLLETGLAQKDEILLLSYSKKSATDLECKVSHISDGLAVETFHALGLKILTESLGKKQAVEDQLKVYITKYFDSELQNKPNISYKVLEFIALHYYPKTSNKKKYQNEGEIFDDLKSCNYTTLKDRLKKLTNNDYRRETLKNEFVKSNEELVIANYFFINGINYEYERTYEVDTSTIDKRQYTPDFYLTDYGIYVEHYGINRQGVAPQYDKKASDEYIKSMEWKRKIHEENQTKCIETYSYDFSEGTIFNKLKSELLKNGVKLNPLSQQDISNTLNNIYFGKDFNSFFNLIISFISLYKAQMKDDSGFDDLIKNIDCTKSDTTREILFLEICKDIYNYYIQCLVINNKIDFDDMILRSTDLLDYTPNFKYKYIIVDEFQDISQSRTKFLQKLIKHGNSKLFAVGDDWQAIYRFAGCDINIFLEFEKIFEGAKINYITSTHRNSTELQQIVEPFITANPHQYKKHIRSTLHQDKPVRVIYYKGNKAMALTNALKAISKIDSNAQVLVLGRNRHDIDGFVCKEIQIYNYQKITHSTYPQLEISYSTIHGSKGLESNFVILISGEDAPNGFPNKTEDDSILSLLLGQKDSYEYAEERRLFYVALTRTKSIVYLLSEKGKSSQFIQEINNRCFITLDESANSTSNEHLCPWCKSGHLIIRKSEVGKGQFYGCSNYPYCKYTNNDMKSVYENKRCPICGDFLTLRKGDYGYFWGCHNYPKCNYKTKIKNSSNE